MTHTGSLMVLLGGGGHARSIVEVLMELGASPLGYIDPHVNELTALPHLAESLATFQASDEIETLAVLAVGDNRTRQVTAEQAGRHSLALAPAIVSPRALVAPDVEIQDGAVVMPGAILRTGTRIGRAAIVNSGAIVDHDCRVGDFAHVGPGVVMAGGSVLEEGSFLGAGSRCIPGVRIGRWSIVGSGAVCVREVPENVVAYGVPARPARTLPAQPN